MTDYAELIARLEAATEGCRELDADIGRVLGYWVSENAARLATGWDWIAGVGDQGGKWELPHYTTSLDAALTLMPEGWIWDVASTGCVWTMPSDNLDEQIVVGGVDNPIIALCIAALKARRTDR